MRKNNPQSIIIHHTATSRDYTTFEAIETGHKRRWSYFVSELGYCMGYHYFIPANGIVKQARIDEEGGAHCILQNETSIGICLTGNFMKETPTQEQLDSLINLITRLRKKWNIPRDKVFGHRQKWATLCPGTNLMKFINDYRQGDDEEETDQEVLKSQLKAKVDELIKIIDSI